MTTELRQAAVRQVGAGGAVAISPAQDRRPAPSRRQAGPSMATGRLAAVSAVATRALRVAGAETTLAREGGADGNEANIERDHATDEALEAPSAALRPYAFSERPRHRGVASTPQ